MGAHRERIHLSTGWRYKSINDSATKFSSTNSWQPSRPLPTEIHLDLMNNGVIANPFLAKNEEAVQWVGEQTWLYETTFEIPEQHHIFRSHLAHAVLVFEGLDTFATVKLNGREILRSDNMFVSHRVELREDMLVREQGRFGPQCLQILFDNAERIGKEEVERLPEHDWFAFDGGTARLATRKAQYHHGWDWGPKLMTCGPWKPIYLDLYLSRISDVSVHSSLSPDLEDVALGITVEVEGLASHALVEIQRRGEISRSEKVTICDNMARAVFHIHKPDLWWPFTLGASNLYDVNVSLYHESESKPELLDKATKSFGVRKVELVQQPLPEQEGSSFFFKINNVPIFAAGSCWIPADSFVSRITPQKYEQWIQLARDSNQVMIRVWGGGVYEHEAFYDACDRMGILVWQDFMFACGNFPAHEQMQKRILVEADQNVRRLRHHPSIVLWCGNNEDYIIPVLRQIEFDGEEKDPQKILRSTFPARYFYEHMLPAICQRLDPGTPYWPGSPYGGSMANSPLIGDIHQWHVWHLEMAPYQEFPSLSGRFVSEFGMQALPCLDTVREFFPPGHNNLVEGTDMSEDEFVRWHNKMDGGSERIAHYGKSNINFQTTTLAAYIYSSQLIQSETLSTAYRSWRRLWQGAGREYCAGALVWQLNDCWPVTSWAIADYHLRPKMAYWAVKRECAPLTAGLARVKKEGGPTTHLDAWAVNMTLADVEVDVTIQAWNVSSGRSIWSQSLCERVSLKGNQATELGSLNLDEVGSSFLSTLDRESGYRNIVFALRMVKSSTTTQPAVVVAQTVNFHEPLHEVAFQTKQANLSFRIVKQGVDRTVVRVTANLSVKGLFVEVEDDPDAQWTDNGLDLVPGQIVDLIYTGKGLEVGQESRLKATWLGGEWSGRGNLVSSL